MKRIHIYLQYIRTLICSIFPFNNVHKTACSSEEGNTYIPQINTSITTNKNSFMKRVLHTSAISAIILLITNLFFSIAATGQSCSSNNIGFNSNTATNTLSICAGTTGTTIDGGNPTGNQVYAWQVSSTLISGPFSTISPNPGDVQNWTISSTYYNTAGTYYFRRVVSSNGAPCDGNSDVVTLTVDPLPTTVTVTGGGTVCGSTTLTASNGGSGTIYYQGTTSNGTSVATASTSQLISASGTYYFRARSAAGCWGTQGSAVVTISANATLSFTSAVGTNAQTKCVNTAITNITYLVGGSGTGATVTGLPAGVTASYNSGTKVYTISGTPTVSGSFSYTVTTTGPCTNTSLGGTINVNPASTISLTSLAGTNNQSVCKNAAITNITYAVGGTGTGASITAGTLPAGVSGSFNLGVFTISGTATAAGTYSYTITTTGGGCAQGTASGTIIVNNPPTATFTKTMASSCGGSDGTITVTPTSGTAPYTYSWTSTPSGFTASTAAVTGLSPKDYSVVVTDANACSTSIPDITIWKAFAAVVTNNGGGSSSCGNTGYIILYGSGGVQPFTYSINGTTYQASNTFTGLAAGTYTGYVKDFGGCVSTKANIVVTGAAPMVVTAYSRPATSCANNGSIELYRTGGVAPYTYSLDNVTYQGSNVFNNLAGAATYTGWVKDASGCKTSLANIAVGKAATITVSTVKTNTSACSNTGTIKITGGGGVPGYSYSLNNVTYQNGNTFTGLAAGTYNAWVKDSKGCKNVQFSVTVGTNAASNITVTANTNSSSSCANHGSIQLFRTGGTAPYTYSLNGTSYQPANTFANLASGTYTGWIKDANGCTGSLAGIVVAQSSPVTVTASHTNTSSCVNDGTIQLNAGGGMGNYTYSLNNITYQAANTFTGLAAGNYSGWVKDSRGCAASVNVMIGQNPIVVTAYAVAAGSCAASNGSIQLFRTGGTGPYTYSLDGNNYQVSNTFTGLSAGTYTGYVKDSKTCVGSLFNVFVGPDCNAPIATNTRTMASAVKVSINNNLFIQAYPNPSAIEFNLVLTGYSKETIVIIVTDIMGRKVYQAEANNSKQQYRFGNDLKPGIYIVQVTQGNQKQSIKIIKE